MPQHHYFAYGSNMIEAQMRERAPTARPLGPARLEGWQFRIVTYGHASVVSAAGHTVHGLLWELTPESEAQLDRYEEVNGNIYRRDRLRVTGPQGEVEALIYIANDNTTGRNQYGASWPEILAAARRFGFPAGYVAELESWSPNSGGG